MKIVILAVLAAVCFWRGLYWLDRADKTQEELKTIGEELERIRHEREQGA